jgi:predicted phage tail protein
LAPNTSAYTVSVGKGDTLYYYQVAAVNTVGDTVTPGFPTKAVQAVSNTVPAGTVTTTTPPLAPTDLTATLQPGPQVLLAWRDNAIDETAYLIERSTNGGAFNVLISVAAGRTTGNMNFTDTTATTGNTYIYRVAAVNTAGASAYATSTAVALPAVPTAPSNVMAQGLLKGNKAQVNLTWIDNANNETGFIIQWTTDPTFTLGLVSANVSANATTYTASSLARSTQYYFRIRAGNGAGQSGWVNANPFPITTP